MNQPRLYQIRQHYNHPSIQDLKKEINTQLDTLSLDVAGKEIGVTVGSRGISHIADITLHICDYIREHSGTPFIIPCMGSHGGATPEGQIRVLSHYGITEESMDCEIRSSMETVLLGTASNGCPVYMDKVAYEADGVLLVNRVKPHTDFIAENESGLVKMVSIGLGNKTGATEVHKYGLAQSIPLVFKEAAKQMPFIGGLAILENSKEETSILKAVKPENLLEEDAALLKTAHTLVPKLPFGQIDVLVVKEMGKSYSGTGMDTKTIGRIRIHGIPEPDYPDVNKLVVLRLSKSSDGNGLGVGLADITTKELADSIEQDITYTNLIHTTFLERGKIPVYAPTEEDAVKMAFSTIGAVTPEKAKVMVIENTLHIDTLWVSEEILKHLEPNSYDLLQEGSLCFENGRLTI
ncbi:lactate racemase domain-containing protein [Anaerolentibacter hominis]|uniref:lactate racemase domain-containing protein n=1 Tax=Anaerolentibacter hominis TaxID=3079009 RepID=UPI0031B86E59